jgi:hypothetical protein
MAGSSRWPVLALGDGPCAPRGLFSPPLEPSPEGWYELGDAAALGQSVGARPQRGKLM